MMLKIKTILIGICLSCALSTPVAAEKYTLGIVPQQSPLKLFKTWKPIADYLSEQTGHTITFKTEKSIADFEKRLYAGEYDIAYMNPYHFVVAHRQQDYQAQIRADKMIRGILVANGEEADFDALINNPETRYVFPSPNAFAATLLTKFELLEKYGVNVEQQNKRQYVNSHDSVYSGIARGTGDLGGGIQRTYTNFSKAADKDKLNVVYTTEAYPSHPIAYKKTIPTVHQEQLNKAFLTMPQALLDTLSIKAMITTHNDEYDAIRVLEEKLSTVDRN